MSVVADRSAYFVDRDGSTYGITSSGEISLTGEITGWIRLIIDWVHAGDDVAQRAESLDPERTAHIQRVAQAMSSLGVLRETPRAGRVRFLGESSVVQRARELSGRPLPDCCLAVGPTTGRWLMDDVLAHPEETYGAVLVREGSVLVVGPASGADLLPVLVALGETGAGIGTVDDDVLRQAAAQLVRRVAAGPRDPWRARAVSAGGSVSTRVTAHPWQHTQPALTGPFDQRAMALIDPDYGVIRLIEEGDLPQIPLHHTRAVVACDAVFDRAPMEVRGEGADYSAARADAVRRALGVRAESVLDPRRAHDRAGMPAAPPGADLGDLRVALHRVLAAPADFSILGQRLSDGAEIRVPVARAFRFTESSAPDGDLGVSETAGAALEEALQSMRGAQAPLRDTVAEADLLAGVHPRAVVVDLDHDPTPGLLGLVVRKVLVLE